MFFHDSFTAIIEAHDDYKLCARRLFQSAYQGEFVYDPVLEPDRVEAASLAGFMPMSADIANVIYFTPKLHTLRCMMDPASVHVSKSARRESRRYSIAMNLDFTDTLLSCAAEHGDDWLSMELCSAFMSLHAQRHKRSAAFISCELLYGSDVVAGEVGYLIGGAYASLSGFTNVSGAGTVQLVAMAGLLAAQGVRVWDLGMPIQYKVTLGADMLRRPAYIPLLESAYALPRPQALVDEIEPCSAFSILEAR